MLLTVYLTIKQENVAKHVTDVTTSNIT